jgi:hypothetical protein
VGKGREIFKKVTEGKAMGGEGRAEVWRAWGEAEMDVLNYKEAKRVMMEGVKRVRMKNKDPTAELAELVHRWGIAEWWCGGKERAREIWNMALKMAASNSNKRNTGVRARVYQTMSWAELEEEKLSLAGYYVCRSIVLGGGGGGRWGLWANIVGKQGKKELERELREREELGLDEVAGEVDGRGEYILKRTWGRGVPWFQNVDDRFAVTGDEEDEGLL